MQKESKPHASDDMRTEVLRRRYLLKDATGKCLETEDQMYRRVARHVAGAEARCNATAGQQKEWEDRFYELMKNGSFLPNTPTLMNAGRPKGMLSACFVVPVEDSIEDIFEAVRATALIQRAGGGTGFSFGRLRPTGDRVASSGGTTSGPISFMTVFGVVTGAIQQGAFRRGANMGMLPVHHPDIIKFIFVKQDPKALTNFNLSVLITDEFMKQLQTEPDSPHVVVNPRTKKRYLMPRSIDRQSYGIDDLVAADRPVEDCYAAREIWEMIVRSAWATGEPGVCFVDTVNRYNPTPHLGEIEATNPCAENPMLPWEACNLGSIDVSKFANADGTDLHWDKLAEAVSCAVRFLDDVIDVNHYPLPQIEQVTLGNRKMGLGVMGFADALLLLAIRYDSNEAVAFAEKLASFIQTHAHRTSAELAKERGCFPNWRGSVWDTMHHQPMRNAAVTTIAPTGTISLLAGCSNGIEPIFSVASKRRALDGREFVQLHPLVERLGIEQGWLKDEVREALARGTPLRDVAAIPRKLAEALVTAHEIGPEWHVRIQAAFQKYVDNAVSKTVNLPSEATVEEVDTVYRLAYDSGCKGNTVYRDGCRENQVISAAHQTSSGRMPTPSPRPRPKRTNGTTIKTKTGCGSLYVTINRDDEEKKLLEVFTNLGKAGGCPSQSEATARVLSVALRSGVPAEVLIEQLKGIRCLSTIARRKEDKEIDVLSCPDAIARALEAAMGQDYEPVPVRLSNACPDCKYPLRKEAGCNVCDNCGYSKCG